MSTEEAIPVRLEGTCHCGAVRLQLVAMPTHAVRCNCSICRRLAAVWADCHADMLRVEGHPASTEAYVWGDRSLRYVRCRYCGCTTHWESLLPDTGPPHVCVNLRNFPAALLEQVTLRYFDGADSWTYQEAPDLNCWR